MLECCVPLDNVRERGVTLEQFARIAACNTLQVRLVRAPNASSESTIDALNTAETPEEQEFRRVLKLCSAVDDRVLVCAYSRRVVGQTGDGHYTCIGGYSPADDSVLVLDTARFKYPPHWLPTRLLFRAMQAIDSVTNKPRGYFVLTPRSNEQPLVLFKLGPRLSAMHLSIGVGTERSAPAACPVGRFILAWNRFLAAEHSADAASAHQLQTAATTSLVPFVLAHLMQCSAVAFADQPASQSGENALLTVQGRCFNALRSDPSPSPSASASAPPLVSVGGAAATAELCLAKELIRGLERTDVHRAVVAFLAVGASRSPSCELLGSLVTVPSGREMQVATVCASHTHTHTHTQLQTHTQSFCDCRQLLSEAHMLSALLLAWPYDQIAARNPSAQHTIAQALETLVDAQLLSASCALLNELRQLRTQLTVLLYNHSSSV